MVKFFIKNGTTFPYFGLKLGIDSRISTEKWELVSIKNYF
jgi:hypothetical protein